MKGFYRESAIADTFDAKNLTGSPEFGESGRRRADRLHEFGEIDEQAPARKPSKLPEFKDQIKLVRRQATSDAAKVTRPSGRPRILAGPKDHEVADATIAALAEVEGLYQRGGQLVEIVVDPEPPKGIIRPAGSMYIASLNEPAILDRMSRAADYFRIRKAKDGAIEQVVPPPSRIAKIVQSRSDYRNIPPLEGILRAPAFLADGTVLVTKGYDRRSGLFIAGGDDYPPILEWPTRSDAQEARDQLLEFVCDFPFASELHKAAWLVLALTPAARFAFEGPVPLGAIDANVRGSGKSKLADAIAMIHLGTDMPRTPYPSKDDEVRKMITATLLAGEMFVLIDNVDRLLGGAALDTLLTSTAWIERLLGVSKLTGRLPANTIWLASGNNLVFGADTARRTLVCRLESPEENPEERTGFRHANLLGWVKANRLRLAAAAVTILRAYHVAGRPDMGLAEWGSFEDWSRLVRNAVVWCGMPDPGETRQEVRDQGDREACLLRQLLAAWCSADPAGTGMTVQEAIAKAAAGDEALQAAFAEIATPGKPLSSRSIGMKLNHLRGRMASGQCFQGRKNSQNVVVWTVAKAGTTGSTGTKSNYSTRENSEIAEESMAIESSSGSPGSTGITLRQ